MGKASRLKIERAQSAPRETHEPASPVDWPHGNVDVALTGDDQGECIVVTVHGERHYLHSTTARELSNMLLGRLDEWNIVARASGFPGV